MDIKEVINKLDVSNDAHWTSDGVPAMDYIREVAGDDKLTRDSFTKLAPELTRQSLVKVSEPAVEKPKGDIHAELAGMQDKINSLSQKICDLTEERAALIRVHRSKALPLTQYNHKTDQLNKIAYIKSQNEAREERARRARAFLGKAAGVIKPSDLTPLSKLDQAMARKNTRGTQRPQVPLMAPRK